jgi:hypothetical protein
MHANGNQIRQRKKVEGKKRIQISSDRCGCCNRQVKIRLSGGERKEGNGSNDDVSLLTYSLILFHLNDVSFTFAPASETNEAQGLRC